MTGSAKGRTADAGAKPRASVVDLFCGAGGLSHGFVREGFDVAAGIDADENCRFVYEFNNRAPFVRRDVWQLNAGELAEAFYAGVPRVLVAGPPCQPFSSYSRRHKNDDWRLVHRFAELAAEVQPEILVMESVPMLADFAAGGLFASLVERLGRLGYWISHGVPIGPLYGLPQRRRRLVLLASRLGPIAMDLPRMDAPSVWDCIGGLPYVEAGASDLADPLHRTAALSSLNLARIRASRPGGTWRDWSDDLKVACHTVEGGKSYSSVYGRMDPNGPAPTITTQFYGFGNGRFGHPFQDRALSLREGAILQSFPERYQFTEPGRSISMKTVGRMIGNAVPVLLGQAIARSIAKHLGQYA